MSPSYKFWLDFSKPIKQLRHPVANKQNGRIKNGPKWMICEKCGFRCKARILYHKHRLECKV